VQLFQRRRWVDPERLNTGIELFVRQLAWINSHTGLTMAGWKRTDAQGEPGAILASTSYTEHRWFLDEVARLQTLEDYAPVNDATAALTVGEDAFERWDAPPGLPDGWTLPSEAFLQVTGPLSSAGVHLAWTNAEGAGDLGSWFPPGMARPKCSDFRAEEWLRLY